MRWFDHQVQIVHVLNHLRRLAEYAYIDGQQHDMAELVYMNLNELDNSTRSFPPLTEAKKKVCLEVMPTPEYNFDSLMERERQHAGL